MNINWFQSNTSALIHVAPPQPTADLDLPSCYYS